VSGIGTTLFGLGNQFSIDNTYSNNTEIISSATFNAQSLAGLGITATGLIGTWQVDGVSGPDGQINVVVGAPAVASVPGPLPLFGAAAAFGWSRKLRRRVNAACTTSII
jgi:hypothetical protein